MDEREQIRLLKNGDHKALQVLMQRYQDYVYTVALRMVRQSTIAEEVTQDVFLKVFQKIGLFEEKSKFSTWLFTIVYRTCLNHLDNKQRAINKFQNKSTIHDFDERSEFEALPISETISGTDGIAEIRENPDLTAILWRAIDRLSAQQGVIISLFYLQQLSIAEIAQIMHTPENSIKTQLHRGRSKLKALLLKEYAPEDLI